MSDFNRRLGVRSQESMTHFGSFLSPCERRVSLSKQSRKIEKIQVDLLRRRDFQLFWERY